VSQPPPPVRLRNGAEPILSELGIQSVEDAFEVEGQLLREAENRTTLRVETGNTPFVLKRYAARKGLLPRWGTSPAEHEWGVLVQLEEQDFPVPRPLAVGAESGPRGRSFLLMQWLPGQDLKVLLREHPVANWRTDLPVRMGAFTRRFHQSGLFHRDYYLNHFRLDLEDPEKQLGLLDLQRVGRGSPPRRRWLIKDLAALASSCPANVRQTERLRFLLAYLGKKRVDSSLRGWMGSILAKEKRIRAHQPKFP